MSHLLKLIKYPSANKLGECHGYIASFLNNADAAIDKTIGLIVLQEWWGQNEQHKQRTHFLGEQLAKKFKNVHVISPDLYRGKVATDHEQAGHYFKDLDWVGAVQDIRATEEHLKNQLSCNKVGITGFCMGGALSLASAAHGISDACVPYYGIPGDQLADVRKIAVPVQGHFGLKDKHMGFSDPASVAVLEGKLKEGNVSHELHMYDADHAFANERRPEVYNKEAADLALGRTVEFFTAKLQ